MEGGGGRVVSSTPVTLPPHPRRSPLYPMGMVLGGTWSRYGRCGEKKNLLKNAVF
jgi:hypothetical protein